MKREIANEKFNFFLNEVEKHFSILNQDLEELKTFYPLTEEKIKSLVDNPDYLKVLDQIAYRYIKLQDTLGKLLRYFLLKEGEVVEHLSMLDIIHRIQKLGIFIDDELWFEMRNLRNSITHEYPNMYLEVAEAINSLYSFIENIEEIIQSIKERA